MPSRFERHKLIENNPIPIGMRHEFVNYIDTQIDKRITYRWWNENVQSTWTCPRFASFRKHCAIIISTFALQYKVIERLAVQVQLPFQKIGLKNNGALEMTRVLQKGTTRRRQNLKEIRANPVSCSLTATISLWGLSAKRIRSRKNIHAQLKRRFWWHPRENRYKNQSQLVSFFFFVRIDETKWASGSLGVGVGPEIGREVVTNERENGGSGRIIHNYLGNAKHCVVPSHNFFKFLFIQSSSEQTDRTMFSIRFHQSVHPKHLDRSNIFASETRQKKKGRGHVTIVDGRPYSINLPRKMQFSSNWVKQQTIERERERERRGTTIADADAAAAAAAAATKRGRPKGRKKKKSKSRWRSQPPSPNRASQPASQRERERETKH